MLIFINRVFLSIFIIITLLLVLIIRLYYMQVINFNKYNKLSYNNCTKLIRLYPKRGIIFDRNGIILAKNNVYYEISIFKDKNFNKKLKTFLNLINISEEDINNIYLLNNTNNKNKFIKINKKFNELDIIKLLVNKHLFLNIKIKKIYKRSYPFNFHLAHSIGYISKVNNNDLLLYNNRIINKYSRFDNIGKIGIERKYEKYLRGKIGFKEIEINNLGKEIKTRNITKPVNGSDIYTSIDSNLSIYISKLTKNSKSAVIVTNSNNGEILSLVSNPSFNPNVFIEGISKKDFSKIILNNSFPMLNRTTQGLYPPASTIKPYIALNALYDNIIFKNDYIFDNGYWVIPKLNKIYKDWKKSGRGWIKLTQAIEESSDIYFYNLAYQCGIKKLFNYIKNFGFGNKTGIDLLEESIGTLKKEIWNKHFLDKKKFHLGDIISIGIGQGYSSVTPIQMSKALMTLVNNGYIKTPHLMRSIYNYEFDKTINFKLLNKDKLKNNINIDHWNTVKHGMYKVSNYENGTVKKYFENSKYKIAAKSGTAQLYRLDNNKTYKKVPDHLKDHKLMIAYGPFENPTYSVVIILENGGFDKFNFGEITRKIFDYLILNKMNFN